MKFTVDSMYYWISQFPFIDNLDISDNAVNEWVGTLLDTDDVYFSISIIVIVGAVLVNSSFAFWFFLIIRVWTRAGPLICFRHFSVYFFRQFWPKCQQMDIFCIMFFPLLFLSNCQGLLRNSFVGWTLLYFPRKSTVGFTSLLLVKEIRVHFYTIPQFDLLHKIYIISYFPKNLTQKRMVGMNKGFLPGSRGPHFSWKGTSFLELW